MRTSRTILVLGLLLRLLWSPAYAIAPAYQTDLELTQYPIIVVAKWDKAPMRPHCLVEGNVCKEIESFTELDMKRVIKGQIKPGRHTVMMGYGVGWLEDGTGLGTWTSTEIPGDVDDVTKPSIWFLDRERSWDTSDTTLYHHLPHYRAVQPLVLEEYFAAIGSDSPESKVPQLLASDHPEVLERTLRYICGGIWPWPNEPDEFFDMYVTPTKRGKVLSEQAGPVREVIGRDVGDVRALAASVYADLEGKDGIKYMRSLLGDRAPSVRAIAIGILSRHRDEASIAAMAKAVRGVNDGRIACKVIETLSSWGDQRLVPILITFLQNDEFAYQYGDDLGIPALKARTALHKITGHWFPHDVAASARAWKRVETVTDHNRRRELLQQLLPGSRFPVVAELIGSPRYESEQDSDDPSSAPEFPATPSDDPFMESFSSGAGTTIGVKNVSNREATIAKRPTEIEQSWPTGVSSRGLGPSEEGLTRDDFVTLGPGESADFEVMLDRSFLLAEPKTRSLRLVYRDNGNTVGINAWIGVLEARFGSRWKEERKREKVEERWPNGNLKVVGQTVNGQESGEWHYFNEEGDRIRIVDYTGGHGEAACNPEHPNNKGAGRKRP